MKFLTFKINRPFIVKAVCIFLFVIYTFLIVDFTLINNSFGRNITNIFTAETSQINEYISQKINLIPFATIKLFVNAYKTEALEPHIVFENILGNLVAFMPFAFLIPKVFSKINSAIKFLITISVSVIIIELLQLLFLTGSADVDDFILNVGGAMLFYFCLKLKPVDRFINKILFGDVDEIKG